MVLLAKIRFQRHRYFDLKTSRVYMFIRWGDGCHATEAGWKAHSGVEFF